MTNESLSPVAVEPRPQPPRGERVPRQTYLVTYAWKGGERAMVAFEIPSDDGACYVATNGAKVVRVGEILSIEPAYVIYVWQPATLTGEA